jgi:hypothetical protein
MMRARLVRVYRSEVERLRSRVSNSWFSRGG